ncbi:MAG TPA: hypothetical protein VGM21_04065 [Actinomycetota bacterium]|jgi:hypothetical protein
MRRNPTPPDPAELRQAASHAAIAADAFARAVASAATAGVVADDEILECSAMLESWASWLAARAAQREGP